jgi:hypothetical protein
LFSTLLILLLGMFAPLAHGDLISLLTMEKWSDTNLSVQSSIS